MATHSTSPLEFQTHDISGRRFADCPGGKPDYLRFDQLFEILPGQSNQFSMGACVKCNLLILRQAFIRKDLDAVEISERWHGARFTIGEPVFEFALGGELSSCRHCFRLKSDKKPPASSTFSRGLINVAMTPITCLEYLIIVRSGEVFGYSRG